MTVKITRPSIDIRGTLDELNKPSGIAGNAMLAAETPQEQFNLIGAGRKNLIINGGFDVWQRGTSFTSVGGGYSADRFFQSVYGGATPNVTKVAGFGDFRNAIRYTGVNGGASEQLELEHRIEGGNLPQTGMLTLSYWIRGSKAGSFRSGRLINQGTGATNTGYGYIEVGTDWSRVTVTFSALAATDAQYYRLFWADALLSYMSDDSVWLEMTGIQLEAGSVATPFEHRSYGEELALCQRYFTVLANEINRGICVAAVWASGSSYGYVPFPTEMRITPSIIFGDVTGFRIFAGGNAPYVTNVASTNETNRHRAELLFSHSGLTVGQAAFIRMTSATHLYADADLY